jgi:c-di-GMP-binding flagellar brake protein YcgR
MFFRRRRFERIKLEDCVVECYCLGMTYQAKVADISEGGMKIDIEEPFNIHQEIELHMTCRDGKELRRRAAVVWFLEKTFPETGAFVGLRFI